MLADVDPIALGKVSISFEKFFSSDLALNEEVSVTFEPRTDLVYIEFKYQSVSYRQYWDRKARLLFNAALNHYKEDYSAKTLVKSPNKTQAIYGKFDGVCRWGQFSKMINSKSFPRMELGYAFSRKGSPYFTVLQREAKDTTAGDSMGERTSLRVKTYFTRIQGDTLAVYFDNAYLEALIWPNGRRGDEAPTEDYEEAGADYEEAASDYEEAAAEYEEGASDEGGSEEVDGEKRVRRAPRAPRAAPAKADVPADEY
jgi:hypothetical protein